MVNRIKQAFDYIWDLKAKRIEKVIHEARHPFVKVQDKVDSGRVVRKRRFLPFGKKSV